MDNAQLDIKKDMAATAYLYQALLENMILQVASCNRAKEIWEALQTRHIGVDRVQKIMAAIEQFTDLEETTLDETIGRLKTFEGRVNLFNESLSDNQDKLLFTNHDNSSRHEKGFKNGGQEKFRRNCKLKDKGQEQSNLVQEDLEPTLLMAVQEKRDKGEKIFLNEKEIKPKKYISMDESLWYLDNGASNHMIGIRTHFKEVDEKISGRVCFGDGSYVKIKGKHSRAPFPNQTNTKSLEPLNLVFRDLCGPISPKTESGKKYMFLLVDDCTRYTRVYFLKSKDEAFKTFKEFKLKVENDVEKKLKSFRTDRGGEFTSREFTRYCKKNGILRQLTAPYSLQQNGIVERRNRNKGLSIIDPVTKDIIVSRDVKFKEDEGWDWKGYLDNINPSEPEWRDFIISKNQTSSSRIIDEVSTQDSERNDEDNAPSPMQNNTHGDISDDDKIEQQIDNPSTPPPYTFEPNSEDSTGYTSSIASSLRPFDHKPVQGYKNLYEIYDRAPEVQSDELLLVEEEPRNYKEVTQDKKWIEAMQIEINSINKNKTWKLATLPDNQKAIGLKWVFKTKRDGNRKIINHKACLVAKGYVQEHGIDYNKVFAPIARMETVRLILALSAYHGCEVYHLDVKSSFYMVNLKKKFMLHNQKNMKLDQTLKSLDFKKCTLEQEIYTRIRKDSMLLVGVYVDDLIVIGSSKEDLQKFNSQMEERRQRSNRIVFYFRNSPISWSSQKQPTVSLSSCELEFMAATVAACQALWLQRLLNALTSWKEEKVTIRVDNKSAITLMKNPMFHGRSKHIDIRHHFIRECVEKNQIEVEHISGDLQRGDILTKALARIKFAETRELLGVKEIKE
uniref:Zinc finger, CCHC-type n=1 Tax=Tanacetum cinerariifolium TaxID=118510 RepID=A0A699I4I0_TANCI|nr:zinc finger, CCHC-type [Tanacetum cinerariifolium]